MPDYTGKPCKDCGGKKSPTVQAELRCLACKRAKRQAGKERAHERTSVTQYGMAPGDYQLLLDAQEGLCPLCRRAKGAKKLLARDHNHLIEHLGRASIRGLICSLCNRNVIGWAAQDDPDFFRRGLEYMVNPPAWAALGTGDEARAALREKGVLWLPNE